MFVDHLISVQDLTVAKNSRETRFLHRRYGRTDERSDGWMDGRMDGRTDGRMDGQTKGRTDKAQYRVACTRLKSI